MGPRIGWVLWANFTVALASAHFSSDAWVRNGSECIVRWFLNCILIIRSAEILSSPTLSGTISSG